MIIDAKQTAVAYRCPACGNGVMSVVGVFSLSGDMIKLKCECGKSEMLILRSQDKKIRLTVPCLVCPKPHLYTLAQSLIFSRDVLAFSCPYSGLDICFVGEKDAVTAAMQKADEELYRVMQEAGIENFEGFQQTQHEEEWLGDPQIYDIVNFMISDLAADQKITCACEHGGSYTFSIDEEGLFVYCVKCGAGRAYQLKNITDAQEFLNIDRIDLCLNEEDGTVSGT